MDNTIFIWYMIVGAVVVACLVYFIKSLAGHPVKKMNGNGNHVSPLSMAKEEELFYVPGDEHRNDYQEE